MVVVVMAVAVVVVVQSFAILGCRLWHSGAPTKGVNARGGSEEPENLDNVLCNP